MRSREFKLKPSRQLMAIYTLVMLVSVIILLCVSLPIWIKLLSFIVVWVYGVSLYKQHIALMSDSAITGLIFHTDSWLLQTKPALLTAALCGESVITRYVSVLRFQIPKQKRTLSCIVFRDSLMPGLYRELVLVVKQA